MDKKGQLGMDTAKAFVIGLLVLLIIGVVSVIVLDSLSSIELASDSYSVTGETGAYINKTGYTLANAGAYNFASPTIVQAVNYSDGSIILAGNYTLSAAGVLTNATTTNYNNVSLSYTYTTGNDIGYIAENGTAALNSFFSSTGTWLALLGVVIIMLIIAIVIAVVNRFGGGRV